MSILNVNKINPVGGGSTITIAGITSFTSNLTIDGTASIAGTASISSNLTAGGGINVTSGSVGINTVSGNEKLDVFGAIRVSGSSANFNAGLQGALVDYDLVGNAARFGHVNGASGSAKPVVFVSGGTERLRIGSAGQLGIGGANYGTSGQVLTSQGSGSAIQWATPSSGSMTLLHTMNINMGANTVSQSLSLTGYIKLMGLVTSLSRSGGVNDTWFGFNGMSSSGNYSWVRSYLDNSNDTSTNRSGTSTGYAYGSVGPGFFINLAGIAAADDANIDAEFTVHNLQESGRKIFTMTSRSFLTRNIVIDTRGSINTTSAITSFEINVSNSSSRLTGGTIKLYGVK
tara:strand:+ start:113 stop:1144 length:1032 start_codon:yes stop_codon:yes gene_type:complete